MGMLGGGEGGVMQSFHNSLRRNVLSTAAITYVSPSFERQTLVANNAEQAFQAERFRENAVICVYRVIQNTEYAEFLADYI